MKNEETSKNYKFNKREYDLKLEFVSQEINRLERTIIHNTDLIFKKLDNVNSFFNKVLNKVDKEECHQAQNIIKEEIHNVRLTLTRHQTYWAIAIGIILILFKLL